MSATRPFLDWLFPVRVGGVLYVSTKVRTATGGGPWSDIAVADPAEAETVLAKHRDHLDVYVATSEFKPGVGRFADAAVARSVLSADIDTKSMPGGTEAERRTVAWDLATSLGPPAVIVETGGGFHVHVRLPADERLQARGDRERVELLGRALRLLLLSHARKRLGTEVKIDSVHDLSRVVRVPGTHNRKVPVAPRPVSLVLPQDSAALENMPLFDPSVLAEFLETAKNEQAAGATSSAAVSQASDRIVVPVALSNMWPLADGDQSGNDWAVARALAEAGESRETAASTIRARRARLASPRDRSKGQRPDYVQRTVERAFRDEERGEYAEGTGEASDAPELEFVTLEELSANAPARPDYVVDGLIATGAVHLLTGKPKESGKTTFVLALVGAVGRGVPFLGRTTQATSAVIVSEEDQLTLYPRFVRFGVHRARLLLGRHRGAPWNDVVERACDVALDSGSKIVVIDTLAAWATFADDAENSSAAMLRVTTVLRAAAARGLAVIVTHHARKGESSMADAPRGSSALAADADVLMQLAPAPKARDLRLLSVHGRLLPEPVDIVFGLGLDGLLLADPDASQDETMGRILEPLQGANGGLPAKEWRKAARMNGEAFNDARRRALEEGLVIELPSADKRVRLYALASGSRGIGDAVPPLTGENSIPSSPSPLVEGAVPPAGTASDAQFAGAVPVAGAVPEPVAGDGVPQVGTTSGTVTEQVDHHA